jgi:hypothetical protein
MFNDDIAKFIETETAIAVGGTQPDGDLPPHAEAAVEPLSVENGLGDKAA